MWSYFLWGVQIVWGAAKVVSHLADARVFLSANEK